MMPGAKSINSQPVSFELEVISFGVWRLFKVLRSLVGKTTFQDQGWNSKALKKREAETDWGLKIAVITQSRLPLASDWSS